MTRRTWPLLIVVPTWFVAGCQTPGKTRAAGKPAVRVGTDESAQIVGNTDPSALKLHDISGALLAYYALHHDLPERFEQLQEVADMADGPIDAACPGSDRPYVYTRDGIKLQDRTERIVVYEPAPLHHGFRLAITIGEPDPNKALSTDVQRVAESFFLLRPPQSPGAGGSTTAAVAPNTGPAIDSPRPR